MTKCIEHKQMNLRILSKLLQEFAKITCTLLTMNFLIALRVSQNNNIIVFLVFKSLIAFVTTFKTSQLSAKVKI